MDFNFNISINLGLSQEAKEWIMSEVSDVTADLKARIDSATNRVLTDVAALKAQVTDLQSRPGISAEELADLKALGSAIDLIDPTTPSVVPVPAPV